MSKPLDTIIDLFDDGRFTETPRKKYPYRDATTHSFDWADGVAPSASGEDQTTDSQTDKGEKR